MYLYMHTKINIEMCGGSINRITLHQLRTLPSGFSARLGFCVLEFRARVGIPISLLYTLYTYDIPYMYPEGSLESEGSELHLHGRLSCLFSRMDAGLEGLKVLDMV